MNDNNNEDDLEPRVIYGMSASLGMSFNDFTDDVGRTYKPHLLYLITAGLGVYLTRHSVQAWRDSPNDWLLGCIALTLPLSILCAWLALRTMGRWSRSLFTCWHLSLTVTAEARKQAARHLEMERSNAAALQLSPMEGQRWKLDAQLFDRDIYARGIITQTHHSVWALEVWIESHGQRTDSDHVVIQADTLNEAADEIKRHFLRQTMNAYRQTDLSLACYMMLKPFFLLAVRTGTLTGFIQGTAACLQECIPVLHVEPEAFWHTAREAASDFPGEGSGP